jgi:pimeloyl-ACP methyl ester carboxylesterase
MSRSDTDWTRVALAVAIGLMGTAALNLSTAAAVTAKRRRGAYVTRLSHDLDLHVQEFGRGVPVLLIHGNGVTGDDWRLSGVVDRLAQERRVIVVDRPGSGLSSRPRTMLWTPDAQADAIAEFLRLRKIGPSLVVGHSIGVQTALALALNHPRQVLGLVLASGYYFPTPRGDTALASPPAIPVLGDLIRLTVSPLLGRLMAPAVLAQMFSPGRAPTAFRREILPMSLRPSQIRAVAADAAYMTPTALAQYRRLGEIVAPVTLIAGEKDKVLHATGHAHRAAGRLTDVDVREVAGAGHMVHYAHPELIASAVDATFERAAEALAQHRLPLQFGRADILA